MLVSGTTWTWFARSTGPIIVALAVCGAGLATAATPRPAGPVVDAVDAGAVATVGADVVVPSLEVVSITQRGGLSADVIWAANAAAGTIGVPAVLSRGFTLPLRSLRRGDTVVQQSSGPGWGFPMAVTAMPRSAVGAVMGRAVSGVLATNRIVIGASTAALRGAQVGDRIEFIAAGFTPISFEVGLIAPDAVIGGTEVVMSTEMADYVGATVDTRIVMYGVFDRVDLERRLGEVLLLGNSRIRVSRSWDPMVPDETMSLIDTKELLGEFQLDYEHLTTDGWTAIDEAWKAEYLPPERVTYPIGLRTRCNHVIEDDLIAALQEIADLAVTAPELINYDPAKEPSIGIDVTNSNSAGGCGIGKARLSRTGQTIGTVSRHSWAQALDVSTEANRQGYEPIIDCRIVRIFRKHGFAWGGNFLTPDGMHFEWVGEPRDEVYTPVRLCPNIPPVIIDVAGATALASADTIRPRLFADDGLIGE